MFSQMILWIAVKHYEQLEVFSRKELWHQVRWKIKCHRMRLCMFWTEQCALLSI